MFGLRVQVGGTPRLADAIDVVFGSLDRIDEGVVVAYLRRDERVGVAYLDTSARYMRNYQMLLNEIYTRVAVG